MRNFNFFVETLIIKKETLNMGKIMDYLNFKTWKSTHAREMQNLTCARPDDIFIFTRFVAHHPFEFESNQIAYAQNTEEAIGYTRHIFLYDILNDTSDDLEFDLKSPFAQRQKDAVLLFKHWYQLGKLSTTTTKINDLRKFCHDFNSDFNASREHEYEIQILNGADQLRIFLISKYSKYENFNKKHFLIFAARLFSPEGFLMIFSINFPLTYSKKTAMMHRTS